MARWVSAALALVVVCALPLTAAEKKKTDRPIGTWSKSEGDLTVTFNIKADGLTVTLKGNNQKIEVAADYGVSKDGVVFGRVNKITKENTDGGPEEGDLFSFRFKLTDNKMTVSELNSTKTSEEARKLVEGDYEQKKSEK
jgi:hypothetical protein